MKKALKPKLLLYNFFQKKIIKVNYKILPLLFCCFFYQVQATSIRHKSEAKLTYCSPKTTTTKSNFLQTIFLDFQKKLKNHLSDFRGTKNKVVAPVAPTTISVQITDNNYNSQQTRLIGYELTSTTANSNNSDDFDNDVTLNGDDAEPSATTSDYGLSTWFSINEGGSPINADIYGFLEESCYTTFSFCDVSFTNTSSINCTGDDTNGYTADWNIDIEVSDAPDNAISYQKNSEAIQSHTLMGTTASFQFTGIPADGNGYDTIRVYFTNDITCGDTVVLKRPLPCPTDVTGTTSPGEVCQSLATTSIGGTAYEDPNYDGAMNENTITGVQGVQVNLYDDCGNISQTTYTDSNGNYLFMSLTNGTIYRVEFVLPESVSCWAKPTQAGVDNGTTVQFVQPGNCASLGLASPSDYCSEDLVFLGTTCFVKRESDGTFSNVDALVSFSNAMGGQAGDNAPDDFEDAGIQILASHTEVGSNYGVAYNRFTNELFSSAYMKYQADFGSAGPGAIYKTTVNPKTGVRTAITTLFADLNTMPEVSVCADPHGTDLDDEFNAPFEASAFNAVGKCSLGDLDISDDGSTLYVVNLSDKKIVAISSQTGAYITSWDFPTSVSTCTGNPNDIRPFGLKYYRGFLYTGSVCSAESTQDQTDLHGFIHKLDLQSGKFLEVLDFPLDYDRAGNSGPESKFNFWVTSIEDIDETGISGGGTLQHYQPMISDIEFDGKKMIIGIRDRLNDQWGGVDDTTLPPGAHPSISNNSIVSHGDILMAFDTGSDNWVLENNGTIANGDVGAIQSFNAGPGGFEFFADGIQTHLEISDGGLSVIPGTGQTILSAMNPPNVVGVAQSSTGGIVWMDNQDGTGQKALILYEGGFQTFSKNNGVGDIEAYCNPAPIEIGNYVWEDTDKDGIQDACESPISGINVSLYKNGTKIAETQTSVTGQYYFSDKNATDNNLTWIGTNADTMLLPNMEYKIVFGESQYSNNELIISGEIYNLTIQNEGINDRIDSDAMEMDVNGTILPAITAMTGDYGCIDHSFDVGFNMFNCPPNICLPIKATIKRQGRTN